MNGYICFGPKGQRIEVMAKTILEAQKIAAERLKVPAKRSYLVSAMLAERDGVPVIHSTAEIG
jgi:hypothetical protein